MRAKTRRQQTFVYSLGSAGEADADEYKDVCICAWGKKEIVNMVCCGWGG